MPFGTERGEVDRERKRAHGSRHHRLKPWRRRVVVAQVLATDVRRSGPRDLRPVSAAAATPRDGRLADEMTSLQPRPRKSETLATKKDRPTRVEHESGRCGAWNLFAACDTRTGEGPRADGFAEMAVGVRRVPGAVEPRDPGVGDDDPRRAGQPADAPGKQVQAWLAQHPRFIFRDPLVTLDEPGGNGSGRILKRKRLRIADFPSRNGWPSG